MTEHEELLGADFFEHDIRHPGVGVSRAVSVLKNYDDEIDTTIVPTTKNKGKICWPPIYSEVLIGKSDIAFDLNV